MKINFLNYSDNSKKQLMALIINAAMSVVPIYSQIKYLPSDERRDAGMGVERVARFFTPAYESTPAQNDEEIRWVQIDLGERRK